MKWRINNRGQLVMTVSEAEQKLLALNSVEHDEFDGDSYMKNLFTNLASGSPFDIFTKRDAKPPPFKWKDPADFGDLTDAPILYRGMIGEPRARWGFMDYQVTSVQRQLMDTGEAVWFGGSLTGKKMPTLSGEVQLHFHEESKDGETDS